MRLSKGEREVGLHQFNFMKVNHCSLRDRLCRVVHFSGLFIDGYLVIMQYCMHEGNTAHMLGLTHT